MIHVTKEAPEWVYSIKTWINYFIPHFPSQGIDYLYLELIIQASKEAPDGANSSLNMDEVISKSDD